MYSQVDVLTVLIVLMYSQVCDGRGICEGALRDDGNVISVQWQDPEVLQSPEGVLLHALQLVVGDDEGGESREVGEHEGGQDRDLVVTQVTETMKIIVTEIKKIIQSRSRGSAHVSVWICYGVLYM